MRRSGGQTRVEQLRESQRLKRLRAARRFDQGVMALTFAILLGLLGFVLWVVVQRYTLDLDALPW